MARNGNGLMRDMAFLAGGMAAGVVGSRLLPPLFAQAVGSAKARMGKDPFERLIRDHRHIASLLTEMERVPQDATADRAKLFLSLKRTLAKHAMAEEDIVYPLLHEEVRDKEQSKHLYDEHADMKIHLYELEQLLKHGADWKDRVRSLRTLIEDHVRDEEDVEFPKLREALDKRGNRTLAQGIRREESLVV